jgi:hypothetical protein
MRISYHDYKLFQRIAESLSKQLSKAIKKERTGSEPKVEEIESNPYVHGEFIVHSCTEHAKIELD